MASPLQKLAKAREVEEIAGQIYQRLATRFSNGHELNKLFGRLASEEQQHALRIDMLRQKYSRDPSVFNGLNLDLQTIQVLIDDGRTLLELLDNEPHFAIDEAVRLAAKLEREFSRAHAELIAETAHPAVKTLFDELSKQDDAHAALLERAQQISEG